MDIPGGGFIAMSPIHHEDRLIRWAIKTGRPIISVDYRKAPEYPFPYALDECVDVYRLIQETRGRILGMGRDVVDVVVTGDSAGANISAAMVITLLEAPMASPLHGLPMPVGLMWCYPALDFNFTSWMTPDNLRVLRRDQSVAQFNGILEAKNHLQHKSPLSVVDDRDRLDPEDTSDDPTGSSANRRSSLSRSFAKLPAMMSTWSRGRTPKIEKSEEDAMFGEVENDADGDADNSRGRVAGSKRRHVREKSLGERVLYHGEEYSHAYQGGPTAGIESGDSATDVTMEKQFTASDPRSGVVTKKAFGTHLTMTSRTGFFNDRIISPSMMRCMAICYIGPRNAPDLTKDYYISPIFAPKSVLARFPPLYLMCGEKDPFVDDTVLIAGKIKEAKRARKLEAQNEKEAKFGESLRMSQPKPVDPIINETEEDWVQMRIFEGWSHGFAQMISLLPAVGDALDLAAGFVTTAFVKNDARQRGSSPNQFTSPARPITTSAPRLLPKGSPVKSRGQERDGDEVLSFTPRRRGTKGSDSRPDSPSPAILGSRLTASPMEHRPTPGLSSGDEHPTPAPDSPETPAYTQSQPVRQGGSGYAFPAVPNGAGSSSASGTTKEGHIIADHNDLLHRRREEANFGIPGPRSPDDHFKPLMDLKLPGHDEGSRNDSDEALKGKYVGEQDLYKRRREEAVYGLPEHDQDDHTSETAS